VLVQKYTHLHQHKNGLMTGSINVWVKALYKQRTGR